MPPPSRPSPHTEPGSNGGLGARLSEIVAPSNGAAADADRRADELAMMVETEETLRAIGAGEVDAFVVTGEGTEPQVFTVSTADRPYRMFVENMREGAATVSADGCILYANRRLAELLACPKDVIVGAPLSQFLAGAFSLELEEIQGAGGLGVTVEFDLLDDNGIAVPVLVGSSRLEVDGERLTCLTFTDLSAQRAQDREIARLGVAQTERLADLQDAQAALVEQATHDQLTGLPNRALLVGHITKALSQAKRSGRCTAVLFVDLDRFKQVNDTRGHAAGDAMLRRVARRLVAVLRPMDTVARIGGDEFIVLAPDVHNSVQAVDLSERLLVEVSRSFEAVQDAHLVAASIGVAVSVGGRGTAEILLDEADTAMYHAKSLGGGRAEVFDAALGREAEIRAAARQMLQSALDDRRVALHYQPIVDLPSGQVAGLEALARISAPDGAIVSPAAFIPAAEDSGLIVPLGTQVLETACQDARRWQPADRPGTRLTMAVNISARQFEPGDLTTIVRERLEWAGLDPACLLLELTETAIIGLHPHILEQLADLRDLGVEIGLDDFGTGYASLTHLRRLPLTFVKIDQSFVRGLGVDEDDDRIVSAVVDLAANLGLRSIAEGVETEDQLEILRRLGCDQAQGYLFARPLPPGDVSAALLRGSS